MTDFFQVLFTEPGRFLWMILLAGWLSAFPLGAVGSLVVSQRISSLAGSIAHFTLSGVCFSLWAQARWGWNLPVVVGALLSGLLAAGLLTVVGWRQGQREDSWVTILWAGGMSVGLLFLSRLPATVDPMGYLFGNILLVGRSDVIWIGALAVVLSVVLALCYRPLLAVAWNESLARVSGLPVVRMRWLMLTLIVATVVLMLKVMGVVLVLGLLVLPAATASLRFRRLGPMMGAASVLTGLYLTAGLWLSYSLDWPTGATTILVAASVHLAALALRRT